MRPGLQQQWLPRFGSSMPRTVVAASTLPRRRVSIRASSQGHGDVKGGWTSRHEPAGLPGLSIERFPSDFRPTSLGRVVLPMKGGKPYVAEDGLPNPLLSTLNAIKYLSSRDADDKDARWNAQALSQFQPTTWALPMRRSSPTMPSGPVSTHRRRRRRTSLMPCPQAAVRPSIVKQFGPLTGRAGGWASR